MVTCYERDSSELGNIQVLGKWRGIILENRTRLDKAGSYFQMRFAQTVTYPFTSKSYVSQLIHLLARHVSQLMYLLARLMFTNICICYPSIHFQQAYVSQPMHLVTIHMLVSLQMYQLAMHMLVSLCICQPRICQSAYAFGNHAYVSQPMHLLARLELINFTVSTHCLVLWISQSFPMDFEAA